MLYAEYVGGPTLYDISRYFEVFYNMPENAHKCTRTKTFNINMILYNAALKKISVMHVIKLGFAPVSFPPG